MENFIKKIKVKNENEYWYYINNLINIFLIILFGKIYFKFSAQSLVV